MMRPPCRRFDVSLSFSGNRRSYVRDVANHLALKRTEARVLYDEFHAAELARPNAGRYLPRLYRKKSRLIVAFLCNEYLEREWCGLEWSAISRLLDTPEEDRIMLLSFDEKLDPAKFRLPHWALFLYIGDKPAALVARLIIERANRTRCFFPRVCRATTLFVAALSLVAVLLPRLVSRNFELEAQDLRVSAAHLPPVQDNAGVVALTATVEKWGDHPARLAPLRLPAALRFKGSMVAVEPDAPAAEGCDLVMRASGKGRVTLRRVQEGRPCPHRVSLRMDGEVSDVRGAEPRTVIGLSRAEQVDFDVVPGEPLVLEAGESGTAWLREANEVSWKAQSISGTSAVAKQVALPWSLGSSDTFAIQGALVIRALSLASDRLALHGAGTVHESCVGSQESCEGLGSWHRLFGFLFVVLAVLASFCWSWPYARHALRRRRPQQPAAAGTTVS